MKKKLVAVFTSLLLVSLICIALVACGSKGIEGNWRLDVSSPRNHYLMEIKKDGTYKRYSTDFGSSENVSSGSLTPTEGHDNCYEITYSNGSKIYYVVNGDQLLIGDTPDIDSTTASSVYTRTKLSHNEWLKEIVNSL